MKKIFIYIVILLLNLDVISKGYAYLQIIAEPGVWVFIDGYFRGKTTGEMNGLIIQRVKAGKHILSLYRDGGDSEVKHIRLIDNQVMSFRSKIYDISNTDNKYYSEEDEEEISYEDEDELTEEEFAELLEMDDDVYEETGVDTDKLLEEILSEDDETMSEEEYKESVESLASSTEDYETILTDEDLFDIN